MCDTVLHIRHNVVYSLVTVCPSRSSVHHFLDLTRTKEGINVTCSRPQRTAHRPGLEPWTPWPEIRCHNLCASPPHQPTMLSLFCFCVAINSYVYVGTAVSNFVGLQCMFVSKGNIVRVLSGATNVSCLVCLQKCHRKMKLKV